MATETHETITDKQGSLTHVKKSNNPSRQGTYFRTPARQYSVHSTMPSVQGRTRPIKIVRPQERVRKISRHTPARTVVRTTRKSVNKIKGPRADQRTKGIIGTAKSYSPILLTEFLVALVLIGIKGTSTIARNGYQDAIAGIMLRYSAVTAVYFILFLMASGKRSSQFAAWFGAAVDLGILFDAVQNGAVADLKSVVTGQGLQIDKTELLANLKPSEFYETTENSASVGGKETLA